MFGFAEKLNIQNSVNSTENCVHYIRTKCLICREIDCLELRKLNGKLCTLHARNVWISRNIELRIHICVSYMYGKLGLAEELPIQICKNSAGNCVHYMYGMSGFAENLNVQICENSTGNCVHSICTECLDLQKKLNIQNSKNSTENCVHYIHTERLDLQKN